MSFKNYIALSEFAKEIICIIDRVYVNILLGCQIGLQYDKVRFLNLDDSRTVDSSNNILEIRRLNCHDIADINLGVHI